MAIKDIIVPLANAAKLARRVPTSALHEATLADSTTRLIREAEAVGLGREARLVRREASEAVIDARQFGGVEQQLVRQGGRQLRTLTDAIRTGSPGPVGRRMLDLFERIPSHDRIDLGLRAIRLMDERTLAEVGQVINNMAGQLREVVAKDLPEVRRAVSDVKTTLADDATASRVLQLIDSGLFGSVELPGRLRGGERFIRLGTDRIVGLGRNEPVAVLVEFTDGTRDTLKVTGALDLSLAIEVKGRTNAEAGIEQLRRLQLRGQPGYAIIGDQLWLLTYDPARVRHLLVAPPGTELTAARAQAAGLRANGISVDIVEIPRSLDDDIKALALQYLRFAASDP